jgi:hypothetical protein
MGSATVTFPARPDKNFLARAGGKVTTRLLARSSMSPDDRVKMAMNQAFPITLKTGPARRLANLDPREILESLDAAGAVLLRGFNFDMDEFEAFTARFCDRLHEVGSRVRLRREGDGYSSEVFRENFTLLAHSEGCYRPCLRTTSATTPSAGR